MQRKARIFRYELIFSVTFFSDHWADYDDQGLVGKRLSCILRKIISRQRYFLYHGENINGKNVFRQNNQMAMRATPAIGPPRE